MKGPRSAPPVQLGGTKDVEQKLQVERETNRQLQQLLIQTEAELLDLKMELKMTRVNQFDDDASSGTTNPSAPPPPYGHNLDNQSHSPSLNSTGSTATSSDNNLPTMDHTDYIDVDLLVNGRRPGWTVHADVHQRVSEVEEEDDGEEEEECNQKRTGEFTFTESALDLITSNNTSPMKRMNN